MTVTATNIDGDRQADLRVHGGPEKAVYSYPSEHWGPWTRDLAPDSPFGPGSFGENLSLAGIMEDEACIGDIWRWGDVRLQICQPRFPCYKLGEVLQNRNVIDLMVKNGRTGWYFRVSPPEPRPPPERSRSNRAILPGSPSPWPTRPASPAPTGRLSNGPRRSTRCRRLSSKSSLRLRQESRMDSEP